MCFFIKSHNLWVGLIITIISNSGTHKQYFEISVTCEYLIPSDDRVTGINIAVVCSLFSQ